jgi:hypothetical protein
MACREFFGVVLEQTDNGGVGFQPRMSFPKQGALRRVQFPSSLLRRMSSASNKQGEGNGQLTAS